MDVPVPAWGWPWWSSGPAGPPGPLPGSSYPPSTPVPTLAGFQAWVRGFMGIPSQAIPDSSVWFTYAFNSAVAQVNLQIAWTPGPQYLIAVYNLAGDRLVRWTPDVTDPAYDYPGSDEPYFAYLRDKWNLNSAFTPGVIEASADEGTSQSYKISDAFADATIDDIALMQTPWGRAYLAIAQKVGSLWGLTP